jgi:hypothetical protein
VNTNPSAENETTSRVGLEHGLNLVEGPGEVGLLNDEGRSQANNGVVGLFAEQAAVFEGLAERAGRAIEFDGQPEAFAADGLDVRALDLLQAGEGVVAEGGGPGTEVFINDDFECSAGDGAGEGVAAEGAAVITGVEDAQDGAAAKDGGYRVVAAGECLTDDDDVWGDVLVLVGEELAGATEAGLDLVEH